MSRKLRLAKEGGWVVAGQIAAVMGSLALVRVLTEYLEPEQYGQLALGLTISSLVNQVVMGGVTAGIGRYYSIAAEKHELDGYLLASFKLMIYSTGVVVGIGLLLIACLFWFEYSHWVGLAVLALIYAALSGYNSVLNSIQTAARQRAIVAFHGGLDAWLKILLAVGVVIWLGASSTAVVISYSCSALLVALSQLFVLTRTIRWSKSEKVCSQSWIHLIWQYSWPFSAFGIFTWVQQVSDRWSLQIFSNTEVVGQYAVIYQLGFMPIAILLGMFVTFLGPILYQRSGDATNNVRNEDVHRLSWKITLAALLLTGLGFVTALIIHEWIFYFLVASEYREISYLLPWLVLAGGLFAAGQMISLKLMSEMRPKSLLLPKVTTALLGVAFNMTGAIWAGLHGIVAALVAFSLVYLLWMFILGRSYHVGEQNLERVVE